VYVHQAVRRGEVLGLAWDQVDLDDAELYVGEQLQRVRGQLVRREVKTETSEAPLPLPELCLAALKIRKRRQDADRDRAGDGWIDTGLVFTMRHGTPIEPRNFNRSFDRCVAAARVPRITVHGTRKTCASLLAALDVHPPRRYAHSAAQQDRPHDGDLHRGSVGRHT
jgi:integrase